MIKLRLHGTVPEMDAFIKALEKVEGAKIMSESSPYKDRGKSEYSRIYLDVEYTEKERFDDD